MLSHINILQKFAATPAGHDTEKKCPLSHADATAEGDDGEGMNVHNGVASTER